MSVRTSESVAAIAKAIGKAQTMCAAPLKDSENPHFRSKYADLQAVRDAMFQAFADNNLCILQMPGFEQNVATLTNRILHASGEWIEWDAGAPIGKLDPQGWRGCVTYLRRTCLEGIANLAAEDDDGNTASQSKRLDSAPLPRPVPTVNRSVPKAKGVPVVPFGKEPPEGKKGVPLSELDDAELAQLGEWCRKKDPAKFASLITQIEDQQEQNRIAANDA